ncbi:MAG: hypothetical protein VKI83_01495 [Synechococcaceae cyanobacterium]|nr:hypothetical protein [Synechococcaceae cyanobacterium]
MTDQPMTAADLLIQAAEELRRCPETGNWPGTWRSPSQRKMHRHDLVREVEVRWLVPEDQGRALPWARERFGRPLRHQRGVIARSMDAAGRAIRFWVARQADLEVYARMLRAGAATCPIEAIAPWTIQPGKPAAPAHPFLVPELWQAIAASEGTPVELPQPDQQAEARKLIEIESAFRDALRPSTLKGTV